MLDTVDSSGNQMTGGAYSIRIDNKEKKIIVEKDGVKEEHSYENIVDSSGNCSASKNHLLSVLDGSFADCNQLVKFFKDNDIVNILNVLNENLLDFATIKLTDVNPKVLYDLLVALYWPVIVDKKDKINVINKKFDPKYENYTKFIKEKYSTVSDEINKLEYVDSSGNDQNGITPNVVQFLEKSVEHLNKHVPQFLNQIDLLKEDKQMVGVEFRLTYPAKIDTFDPNNFKLFHNFFTPRIERRNREMAHLAQLPGTFFKSQMYSFPMVGGSSSLEKVNLFNDLIAYYRESIERIRKAIELSGKSLHEDVLKNINKRLDNFEKYGNEFGDSINLLVKYNNVNKQFLDSKLYNITENDMKSHIDAVDNKLQKFTKSEVDVLKIISKLQETLSKINFNDNYQIIPPR